eukprot:4852070-Pleurochrysis_carterae.AAC.1
MAWWVMKLNGASYQVGSNWDMGTPKFKLGNESNNKEYVIYSATRSDAFGFDRQLRSTWFRLPRMMQTMSCTGLAPSYDVMLQWRLSTISQVEYKSCFG